MRPRLDQSLQGMRREEGLTADLVNGFLSPPTTLAALLLANYFTASLFLP